MWRGMKRQQSSSTSVSPSDAELQARLSRLRSELKDSKLTPADGQSIDPRLVNVEQRLGEAEDFARKVADPSSETTDELTNECLLAVHEVEADLCLFKPEALLYPTWIRLQGSLYRFEQGRRDAWNEDIARRIQADVVESPSDTLRRRLRQLTLELNESAGRYNRLAEERAGVTRKIIRQGVALLCTFVLSIVGCLTLSIRPAHSAVLTAVSLLAGVLSGGAGGVFSRLRTLRYEHTRGKFTSVLKWDMALRACIGCHAALIVGAALLSGWLRGFLLPDEGIARVALFVVLGFAAGFSDRLFMAMLSPLIGTRRASAPKDRG